MSLSIDTLKPPQSLALAYAKHDSRIFLELLLLFDVKLGGIIRNGKEPLIGQMRLAWWRDVISKPAAQRPSGEPLLAQLSALDETPLGGKANAAMLLLVDAWDALLADDEWNVDMLLYFARQRAEAVFVGFANAMDSNDDDILRAQNLGERWALASLLPYCQTSAQHETVDAILAEADPYRRLSRPLRPLSILAFAARQEHISGQSSIRQGLRLIFNALTGW